MSILVLGASGATGRHLTDQLLKEGEAVRIILRESSPLPEILRDRENLTVIRGTILEMSPDELDRALDGCRAAASCLGHNLSFKGIWGPPRRLVRDALRRVTDSVERRPSDQPFRFVLMNTTGHRNRDLNEPVPLSQEIVVTLLRHLLPPQADNEQAAEHLRQGIGQNHPRISWVVVRPDGLVDSPEVSPWDIHPSPVRNPIFDAGKTSRINVGRFMAELLVSEDLWKEWQGRMPVLYNRE